MTAPFGSNQGGFLRGADRDPANQGISTQPRLDCADGYTADARRGGYGVPPVIPPIGLMSGNAWMVLLTVSYPCSVKVTVYAP